MTEVERAGKMVHKRLTDNTALMALITGVYRDEAPVSAVHPYIVFDLSESGDEAALDGKAAAVECELFARVIGQGAGIGAMNEADTLMNQSLAGWQAEDNTSKMGLVCQRARPYNQLMSGGGYDGLPAIGGYYRLQLMPDDGGQ